MNLTLTPGQERTLAARQARRERAERARIERAAEQLRAAGWKVEPPATTSQEQ